MGLFTSLRFDSFDDLFVAQLRDLYDAEHRIIDALPKLADAAASPELREVLLQHREETKGQVQRLEQMFQELGIESKRMTCEAMKGLVTEGEEMLSAKGADDVRDAAIIAAAQRVEHYEIAGYGTARTWADRLGHTNIARLLQETLDEEGNADKILTQVAEQSVNIKAQQA